MKRSPLALAMLAVLVGLLVTGAAASVVILSERGTSNATAVDDPVTVEKESFNMNYWFGGNEYPDFTGDVVLGLCYDFKLTATWDADEIDDITFNLQFYENYGSCDLAPGEVTLYMSTGPGDGWGPLPGTDGGDGKVDFFYNLYDVSSPTSLYFAVVFADGCVDEGTPIYLDYWVTTNPGDPVFTS